jgi:hypothetical protein
MQASVELFAILNIKRPRRQLPTRPSRLYVQESEKAGVPSVVNSVAKQNYKWAVAQGLGDKDMARVVEDLEHRAGVKIAPRLKWLRSSPFDPFGRTAERRMERSLIQEYTRTIERVMDILTADNFETAVVIASSGEDIGGFGHIKKRAAEATRLRWKQLEADLRRAEVVKRRSG